MEKAGCKGGTYIEPFAGGAGIALNLLENGVAGRIAINDYDIGIFSFWHAILNETDRFIDATKSVPVDMEEWHRQRQIVMSHHSEYSFELGFATFFMNRTNRSGIIQGGVIGGLEQKGIWKLDVRFKRQALIDRIVRIAKSKDRIQLTHDNAVNFITEKLSDCSSNTFIYFDPPYFEKGKQLYMNFFDGPDHAHIEEAIRSNVTAKWVVTYDDVKAIEDIYSRHIVRRFDLTYSAAKKRQASEIIVFGDESMIPTQSEMKAAGVNINLR